MLDGEFVVVDAESSQAEGWGYFRKRMHGTVTFCVHPNPCGIRDTEGEILNTA